MFRLPSARAAKFDNFMKPSTPARANIGTAFTGGRAAQLRPSARALLGSWVLIALTPRCTGGASSAAEDIALFRSRGVHHGTDKVTGLHAYQTMYGQFLMPLRHAATPIKLFEIGLGCHTARTRRARAWGGNTQLWLELFPQSEIWEADFREECAANTRKAGGLKGINTVFGDQGDPATVQRWVRETGGSFDVIIDDGGHTNRQIKTSFDVLWPSLKPGGYYFMEDLQVGRTKGFNDGDPTFPVISDLMQSYIEQLVIGPPKAARGGHHGHAPRHAVANHSLPENVSFVLCQHEACVLGKRP